MSRPGPLAIALAASLSGVWAVSVSAGADFLGISCAPSVEPGGVHSDAEFTGAGGYPAMNEGQKKSCHVALGSPAELSVDRRRYHDRSDPPAVLDRIARDGDVHQRRSPEHKVSHHRDDPQDGSLRGMHPERNVPLLRIVVGQFLVALEVIRQIRARVTNENDAAFARASRGDEFANGARQERHGGREEFATSRARRRVVPEPRRAHVAPGVS